MNREPKNEMETKKPIQVKARILVLFGSAAVFGAERGNLEALITLREAGAELLCLVRHEEWCEPVTLALDEREIPYRKVPFFHFGRGLKLWVMIFRNPYSVMRANFAFIKAWLVFRPTHIYAYSQLHVLNFIFGLTVLQTPLVYRAGDEPTLHNAFFRWSWYFVTWRVSRFVANSRFVASSLEASSVDPERIQLIYNAPPRRFGRGQHISSAIHSSGLSIGFVGQISKHKGTDLLIEAFKNLSARHPTARLRIAGRISDWEGDAWARKLRDQVVSDPDLCDRVEFLGYVENVPSFMAECTFIVVPSLFEDPSPNVVTEAKLARRAVIGFPRGGIPELIKHDVEGLVCEAATAHALENELEKYLAQPSLAELHGEAGPASIKRLEVDRFQEKWCKVIS